MSMLLAVIAAFALFTLVVAGMQIVAILRLAPASANLAGFLPLGWWKFSQIEQKAGAAAAAPLNIYKRAVVAFLVFLVLGLILSGWAVNQAPPASRAAAAQQISDTRVIPAQFAFNSDLRRVATMPGAPKMLES